MDGPTIPFFLVQTTEAFDGTKVETRRAEGLICSDGRVFLRETDVLSEWPSIDLVEQEKADGRTRIVYQPEFNPVTAVVVALS